MKNATRMADRLKSLYRSLSREFKPTPPPEYPPLDALVRAAMSCDVSDSRAEEAIKLVNREFVDLNELRVATELEVQELLGVRYPAIEQRVQTITHGLNAIFEKEHTLSLDRLKTISKRDARQFLRDLPDMNPFVEAYVMMYALSAPAFPMDEEILGYLREEDVFNEETTVEEAQRFMEHHVKPEELHDYFTAMRKAAHEGARKKR